MLVIREVPFLIIVRAHVFSHFKPLTHIPLQKGQDHAYTFLRKVQHLIGLIWNIQTFLARFNVPDVDHDDITFFFFLSLVLGTRLPEYHVEFFLLAKHHGEEEGGDNAACYY